MGAEESQLVCTPSSAAKRKRKLGGDSDDDDDDDDDSDDPADDEEEEEEEEIKKVKKVETYDEVTHELQRLDWRWEVPVSDSRSCSSPSRTTWTRPPAWRSWRSRSRN